MLRKTNQPRGSMKRPIEKGGALPDFSKPVVYNSRASRKQAAPQPPGGRVRSRTLSPNQHQIAPGLILEGESADL